MKESRTTDAIIKAEAGRHEIWKKVGTVTVDAGILWIGDPCRLQPDIHNKHPKWSPAGPWDAFCAWLGNADASSIRWVASSPVDMATVFTTLRSGIPTMPENGVSLKCE
jgi:hypothetical protein